MKNQNNEEIWRKENRIKTKSKQLPKELEGVIPRITTIEEKVKQTIQKQ